MVLEGCFGVLVVASIVVPLVVVACIEPLIDLSQGFWSCRG